MTELFRAMILRADPTYLKRPKPFLQYVIIGEDTSCLSDLFFAQIDRSWLDRCLRTEFDENSMEEIIQSAQRFESQVLARCAGLVEVAPYKPARVFDVPRREWLSEVDKSAHHTAHISTAVGGRPLSFIHRTAWDFLVDDPAGQNFLSVCSIDGCDATIDLLRAKLARVKLGVDCLLSMCALEDWGDDIIRDVGHLERKAEAYQTSDYHYFSLALQAEYLKAAGLSQSSPMPEMDRLATALNLGTWSPALPFDLAVNTSYACRHSLHTLIQALIRSASLHDRQQIIAFLWIYFCVRYANHDIGPHEYSFLSSSWRDRTLVSEMCSISPSLLTKVRLATNQWNNLGWWSESMPAPLWSAALSSLLGSNLYNNHHNIHRLETVAQHLHTFFREADLPLLTEFYVALSWEDDDDVLPFSEGDNNVQPLLQLLPKFCEVKKRVPSDGPNGLMLRWTIEGLFRWFMSETLIEELYLPMTGSLPCATHWRRAKTRQWLGLETVADATYFDFAEVSRLYCSFGTFGADFMLSVTEEGVAKCHSAFELFGWALGGHIDIIRDRVLSARHRVATSMPVSSGRVSA